MTTLKNKNGFSALIGIVIAAIVLLGAAGFYFMGRGSEEVPSPTGENSPATDIIDKGQGPDTGGDGSGSESAEPQEGADAGIVNPPTAANPTPGSRPVSITDVEEPPVETFHVTAKNFSFSLAEIRVRKGSRVKINLNVAEGFHDLVLDEFNARTMRGGEGTHTSVEFVADKAGTFEYYCSVGNHRQMGMVGKLIVEE
ncbi:MAG: plastocyanin/azurin family copper-binding protein [Patescibacteria group bacterium]